MDKLKTIKALANCELMSITDRFYHIHDIVNDKEFCVKRALDYLEDRRGLMKGELKEKTDDVQRLENQIKALEEATK